MIRPAVTAVFVCVVAAELHAQGSRSSGNRPTVLEAATRLANAGEPSSARALIDSVMQTTAPDSHEYSELLFARATFSASVLDAGLDYEKIIADFPSATRREESLLRVAQRAIIGGDPDKALGYLRRMQRDYPKESSQITAGYWVARVELDLHDVAAACDANRAVLTKARNTSHALATALVAQAQQSCAAAPPVPSATPVVTPPRPATASAPKRYAVQLSAFATRADADAMAARLIRQGLDAHVDGTTRPYRVRVGRYDSYAEATAELRELKKRKLSGFVAEMNQ